MSRFLTPADKARQTRTRKLATQLEAGLAALQAQGAAEGAVVLLFSLVRATPASLCDAFWLLDNDWRTGGHSLLRRCRNHPEHGPALFALFA